MRVLVFSFYDLNPVHMVTTIHSDVDFALVTRRRPKPTNSQRAFWGADAEKQYRAPRALEDYNHNMNGVDRNDQLVANKRVDVCSRKWWHSLVWYSINVAAANAYILYRAMHVREGREVKLTHFEFHYKLAKSMMEQAASCSKRNKRSADGPDVVVGKAAKKHMRRRFNRALDHYLVRLAKTGDRSQRLKCVAHDGQTTTACHACHVALCIDCFPTFHGLDV